ncbi:hypothetical protein [Segatella maculosa]|uniref:hypothetical protein n=1 Tax=Segatella maculosa TaxID=439703 RepID=UPI0023EFA189|nr:hypothetical protein [Segatella maculosa]
MEKRKYGAMLPAKTVWRLLIPCMGEHRKTTEADLPSDYTQVGTGWLQAKINRRPRGKLNFATPRLEFYKYYSECCT